MSVLHGLSDGKIAGIPAVEGGVAGGGGAGGGALGGGAGGGGGGVPRVTGDVLPEPEPPPLQPRVAATTAARITWARFMAASTPRDTRGWRSRSQSSSRRPKCRS